VLILKIDVSDFNKKRMLAPFESTLKKMPETVMPKVAVVG
jgi:hypothetical protein